MIPLAPGIMQCEACKALYPHDKSYEHWLAVHAPKEQYTSLKEIYAETQAE